MQIAIERSMKDIDCKYDDNDYDDDDDEDGISYGFDDSEPAQRYNPVPIPNGTAYSKSEYGDDGRTLLRRIQQQHLRGGGQLQNVVMVTDGDRVSVHEPESRVSPLAMEHGLSPFFLRNSVRSQLDRPMSLNFVYVQSLNLMQNTNYFPVDIIVTLKVSLEAIRWPICPLSRVRTP